MPPPIRARQTSTTTTTITTPHNTEYQQYKNNNNAQARCAGKVLDYIHSKIHPVAAAETQDVGGESSRPRCAGPRRRTLSVGYAPPAGSSAAPRGARLATLTIHPTVCSGKVATPPITHYARAARRAAGRDECERHAHHLGSARSPLIHHPGAHRRRGAQQAMR